jgi:hypothetical protein
MPKGIREPLQELEGGKGFGGMGGGGGGRQSFGMMQQAVRNAAKNKTDVPDEYSKLQQQLQIRNELSAAKAKPERQSAEKNAVVTQEGGVKKTTYPYAGQNEYKKGGVTRADGCITKGHTKGRMV